MRRIIIAMVKKDLKELFSNNQVIAPILIVPLVLLVFLPTILILSIQFGFDSLNSLNSSMQNLRTMMEKFPMQLPYSTEKQNLYYLAVNFMFPPFFLLIPLMCASIMGAASFVGEREHKTMETLLYCPVTVREIFLAKIISSFIPAYCLTLLAAILFGLVINTGSLFILGGLIFPDIKWLVLIFWLSPALTFFALVFIVLTSAKSETFMEAQQTAAFLVIPFIFLLIGQVSGLFFLDVWIIAGGGLFISLLNWPLFRIASSRFIPEKLV